MKWLKEIVQNENGSALATVLIISVIISLFIGAILSGIVLQSRFIQRDVNSFKALYAAEEGAYRFLNEESMYSNIKASKKIILSNGVEVKITAAPFGGFLDITSTANISGQTRTIRMLSGNLSTGVFEKAVALGDSNSSLTVTGNTKIEGDILTFGTGLRAENFKGIPFRGSINGDQKLFSDSVSFPMVNRKLFDIQEDHFTNLLENRQLARFSTGYEGWDTDPEIKQGDTLYFDETTEWVTNQSIEFPMDMVVLVNGSFTINGDYQFNPFTKIIVRDTLLVGRSAKGNQMLFYAGKSLQIGGSTSISAQVMSRGSVIIRDEAYLHYPSMVYSSKENYQGGVREAINITGKSIVDGTVIYPFSTNGFNQDFLRVKVDTNASVRGAVYNAGQTELLGSVFGSVVTHQFYFYESPTSYINWLKDVIIDVSQRPDNYVLPIGFSDSTQHKIVDWYELEE